MRKSLCLLSIALPAAHGHAQAINDDCVDAIAIAFGTTGFSTLDATDDGPALPSDCDEGFG
ncbi:MAG: hypothetical protein VX672_01460, partial [Planctomycetota bacterium]|nr:hypothetical protein [Planctomycetota bacterium]